MTGRNSEERQEEHINHKHRVARYIASAVGGLLCVVGVALASNQSRPGEHFAATLSEPIVVEGKTVIPQGTHVKGLVVDAHHSGRLSGRARLQLALEIVEVNSKSYQIRTTASQKVGGNHNKRNFAWIGGGAGGGLLIGALAGGGKGALIGGPVGAGAGTAAAFFTGKRDIKLPAETVHPHLRSQGRPGRRILPSRDSLESNQRGATAL